jgi:hypothetical protein
MADVLRHEQCPQCAANGNDRSHDNMAVYSDGGKHCFACGYHVHGTEEWNEENMSVENIKDFSEEARQKIKDITSTKGKGYRGLDDKITGPFGVRYEYDESTGAVAKQYYPVTIKGELSGYKIRKHPKSFLSVGETGRICDLFGQFKFKQAGKYVLICGGEVDQLSAYQMLREYQLSKAGGEDYAPIAVVSPTIGENCKKQIQKQYDFLNQFERIIVGFDNDEAGRKATEDVIDVLPRGKVWIANWGYKDPNEYLVNGKSREFVRDFYNAEKHTPAGVIASDKIFEEVLKRAESDKLPFAPFLNGLNEMLAGGITYGFIVNILAGSGCGKSALINENVIHWTKKLDVKVGVVSLEADAGYYGEQLLSRYIGKKIALIDNKEDKVELLTSDNTKRLAHELFTSEDGSPSFYILDDRGDFSQLQEKIEELVVAFGVRVIIIDVISDVFAGMTIEQVDKWMQWEKCLVKQYNCILVNIAHVRKASGGEQAGSQGAFLTEESILGSGSQFRSAGINISLQRDKNAEDEIDRNTTYVHLLKSRDTGMTGKACEVFYDLKSHTLYDKEYYFSHVT